MKSSMITALGCLAVLGKAQQHTPQEPSGAHLTVSTIATVNVVKLSTEPITIARSRGPGGRKRDGGNCRMVCDDAANDISPAPTRVPSPSPHCLASGNTASCALASFTSAPFASSASVAPVQSTPVQSMPVQSTPAPATSTLSAAGPSSSPPVRPHDCPTGEHLCPQTGNFTTVPLTTVTTGSAGYVQPVAGMAMVIVGVFGLFGLFMF